MNSKEFITNPKILILLIILIIIIIACIAIYIRGPQLQDVSFGADFIDNVPITERDLECGTYYGTYDQKKPGTPDDWIHIEAGRSSRWSAPNVTILPMDCVKNQHDPGITILE